MDNRVEALQQGRLRARWAPRGRGAVSTWRCAFARRSTFGRALTGAVTFVGMPWLAALPERLPRARLVAIGDSKRQARLRRERVVLDWVSLEARSEKITQVGDLQPS
jgi:hypothetical protein